MKKEKRTLSYRMVKEYFRFIINGLYYRKFYSIDSQNIPADGTPVLIVSDHQGQFGKDFARSLGKDPDVLPEKLEADKELVARLADRQETFDDVRELRQAMAAHGMTDREFRHRPRPLLKFLLLALLLPLAIVGVWPAIPTWLISEHFSNRMEDRMFQGSFLLPASWRCHPATP